MLLSLVVHYSLLHSIGVALLPSQTVSDVHSFSSDHVR